MRLRDDGFVAMFDAMLFIALIVIASSVTMGYSDYVNHDHTDTSGFLDDLMSSEVRMSDMTEGDGSIIRMSDAIALYMVTGAGKQREYLDEVLSEFSHGRDYTLELLLDSGGSTRAELTIGGGDTPMLSRAVKTYPVSTGDVLEVVLTIHS